MKCPSCSATIGALDKICPYCGAEIPPAPLPSVATSPEQPLLAVPTAASLCDKIQEDLAALALKPPTSSTRSVLVGLLTPPSLGLIFILSKALEVFGRQGSSPNRLILSIDGNIRKGMTAYKNDPAVAGSLRKYAAELAAYHAKRHSSHKAFWAACAASVVVIAALALTTGMLARREVDRKSENLKATVAQIQAGSLPGALAIMAKLPEAERKELTERDSFAQIAQAILDGQDKQALDLAKSIPDPEARTQAVNFLGEKMLDQALKTADYPGALDAAGLLSPEAARTQAEDSVRTSQATAFIDSNQMDQAKAIMANIRDEPARAQLEKMIQAKLPKAKLDGF